MFNLEGLIPKLCDLAQEIGDDERALRLRSAGLQVLASMVNIDILHYLCSNSVSMCMKLLIAYCFLLINLENLVIKEQFSIFSSVFCIFRTSC